MRRSGPEFVGGAPRSRPTHAGAVCLTNHHRARPALNRGELSRPVLRSGRRRARSVHSARPSRRRHTSSAAVKVPTSRVCVRVFRQTADGRGSKTAVREITSTAQISLCVVYSAPNRRKQAERFRGTLPVVYERAAPQPCSVRMKRENTRCAAAAQISAMRWCSAAAARCRRESSRQRVGLCRVESGSTLRDLDRATQRSGASLQPCSASDPDQHKFAPEVLHQSTNSCRGGRARSGARRTTRPRQSARRDLFCRGQESGARAPPRADI